MGQDTGTATPLHVVHVASEVAPFAETGGLGVVAGALPAALPQAGVRASVITPCYGDTRKDLYTLTGDTFDVVVGPTKVKAELALGRLSDEVPVYLVKCDPAFGRPGLYGPRPSADYPDNAWRFAVLAEAAFQIMRRQRLHADVLHCHDWQTGLLPLLARTRHGGWVRTVQTIHNLGYHGTFPPDTVDELGLPREHFRPDGYEFWGWLSFLKAGLVFADRLTTVSPTYAGEIQTARYGHGLDGVLRSRAADLTGILNGIPTERHDPADPRLPAAFSADDLGGKAACKAALAEAFGLEASDTPILAVVSRLVTQKGMDLIVPGLWARLDAGQVRLVALGTGDPELEKGLTQLGHRFPGRAGVRIAFDEGLARLVLAGADALLMPSRYEPCGLTQLFALRYGTLPIVRATGGLVDTISPGETGFVFDDPTAEALDRAVATFLDVFYSPERLLAMRQRAMREDFSWHRSAARYAALYGDLARAQ